MLDSIYVGLTGLTGFSQGLNNISNNVANLNTPGFKSSQLQFSDLFYRYQTSGSNGGNDSSSSQGSGLKVGGNAIDFKQGQLSQTGNDQDAAIQGNGFFVVRAEDQVLYTRDGQFSFDTDGYLVSRVNQGRIAALTGADTLQDINISGLRSNPPKVTSQIKLSGSLVNSDTQFDVNSVTIFDALGTVHTLNLHFDNNNSITPGSWLVTVKEGNTVIKNSSEIQYANGNPVAGFNSDTFTYTPTNGAPALNVTLDFSGTDNFSTGPSGSSVQVASQDGFAAGSLTKATFDTDGFLVTTYSNGQTTKQARLALASFNHLQGLAKIGNNMYANSTNQDRQLGTAGQSIFGQITGGSIELSNVDLAQQFSELIITQRGYQGSSQIISAANEMIQQLYDMRSKR